LIIPIENSLLYVQPLYLSASDRVGLPELRRVIVAFENNVVMEENLELALQRLFGKGQIVPKVKALIEKIKISTEDLAKEAKQIYDEALEFLRQGNWADYGKQIEKLGEILNKMAE
jgi:uncharacterized membrane protein (UPF0182 family)